jgi:hypothetical protein
MKPTYKTKGVTPKWVKPSTINLNPATKLNVGKSGGCSSCNKPKKKPTK